MKNQYILSLKGQTPWCSTRRVSTPDMRPRCIRAAGFSTAGTSTTWLVSGDMLNVGEFIRVTTLYRKHDL